MSAKILAVLLGMAFFPGPFSISAATIDEDTAREIAKGATETFVAFRKDPLGKTGASEIPNKFWTTPLRNLKPVKVYLHMNNVVVVQNVAAGKEEGVYIYEPYSSYLPFDGQYGFALTPKPNIGNTYTLGTGVFSYQKMTTNQPAQLIVATNSVQETNRPSRAPGSGR